MSSETTSPAPGPKRPCPAAGADAPASEQCGRSTGDTLEEGEFQLIPGWPGRLFVPRHHGERKHPCRECFACQHCPDARCAACLGR